jgi:hypothetical protein
MPVKEIDSRLGSDLLDDQQDIDVYGSLAAESEPGAEALSRFGAAGAEDMDFMDDELINHEDPYLQGLFEPSIDD